MVEDTKDNMLQDLKGLVQIESISGERENEYPFGKGPYDALQYCLNLCKRFGFRTKQCGNYMGYAEIGEGERLMGILVHLDVVPAGEGWSFNPFDVTIESGKCFGRGVIDDKGPAIAVIYAMKDIVDKNIKLDKRVRLIFGCSEECGAWEDMEYYKKTEQLPDFGFTPDADFPLIYAEMGILEIELTMYAEKSGIKTIQGGDAKNMVASLCKGTYFDGNNEEVTIVRYGKSAHGSMPWLGENAIGLFMKEAKGSFAEFYNSCIGMTWDGSCLNCQLSDEETGPITINPGLIKSDDEKIILTLDVRYPISYTEEDVVERIKSAVAPYDVTATVKARQNPVYIDKNSKIIKTLMNAYTDITGESLEPLTMGGGTYARAMKNIVAFGPVFPGRECTEHQPDEYILIEDLYMAEKIYRAAIENA